MVCVKLVKHVLHLVNPVEFEQMLHVKDGYINENTVNLFIVLTKFLGINYLSLQYVKQMTANGKNTESCGYLVSAHNQSLATTV